MILRTYKFIFYESVESDFLKNPKIEWRQEYGSCWS